MMDKNVFVFSFMQYEWIGLFGILLNRKQQTGRVRGAMDQQGIDLLLFFDDLGTLPRMVTYLLAFSFAIRIRCFGAIVNNCLCLSRFWSSAKRLIYSH